MSVAALVPIVLRASILYLIVNAVVSIPYLNWRRFQMEAPEISPGCHK